jgi:YD repeat-containing protein
VTKIRQYEGTGAITNPRYQETTFSYDGYSRLSQQHTPVQTAGTFTTWTYRADGTVNTTTDSRGVVATYSYNNRGQITNITFDEPTGSNIPDTPDVNYQYDAVGNRTQMNDGLGAVFYEYDELSRLKSEKREFNFYLAQAPLPNYGYKIIYE